MALRAMATRPMGMDGLVEATTSRISETTMIGKTIMATDITIHLAATAASVTRVALAADMKEGLVAAMEEASVVGMASAAEALAVAMAVVAVAGIAKQPGRRNHA